MIKIFSSCVAMFVLAVGIAVPDVTGPWRVAVVFDAASRPTDVPPNVELACVFAQRGEVLTGECRPADGPDGVAIRGKTHADSIEWTFDIALNDAERKEPVTFTGTVSDDRALVTGTFAIADYRGTFTAHRE